MPDPIQAIEEVASFLRDIAREAKGDYPRILNGHADRLEVARAELVRLSDLTTAIPPDLGSLHDLPRELREELSVARGDNLEDQLVTVINSCGGEASLDQILVGLFRKFNEVHKRRFIQNKLYRMSMVWGVDGKKGVYTTEEPDGPPEQQDGHGTFLIDSGSVEEEAPF